MIGCQDVVDSSSVEVIDDNGNRIYKHNISFDPSLYDNADASTGMKIIRIERVLLNKGVWLGEGFSIKISKKSESVNVNKSIRNLIVFLGRKSID